MAECILVEHVVERAPCPGPGFGVEAGPHEKPGSGNLFDARTEPQAKATAADVHPLPARCDSQAPVRQ